MKKQRKLIIIVLFLLGILFTIGAPYFPDFMFSVFRVENLYNYKYVDLRFAEVIPSIHLCGLVFMAWGIVLYLKGKK